MALQSELKARLKLLFEALDLVIAHKLLEISRQIY
jgi:hypothetical protein